VGPSETGGSVLLTGDSFVVLKKGAVVGSVSVSLARGSPVQVEFPQLCVGSVVGSRVPSKGWVGELVGCSIGVAVLGALVVGGLVGSSAGALVGLPVLQLDKPQFSPLGSHPPVPHHASTPSSYHSQLLFWSDFVVLVQAAQSVWLLQSIWSTSSFAAMVQISSSVP